MKKTLFPSILLILFININSSAQQGLRIGAMGIPQNVWLLNSDESKTVGQDLVLTWGSGFGAIVGYGFTSKFGMELDVIYSKQGQAYKKSGTLGIPDHDVKLSYLKIPLLFRFNISPDNRVAFVFDFGPQLGFRTSANYLEGSSSSDVKSYYNKTYTSAVLDLGADIKLVSSLYFNIHFRGDYSLTDIEDKSAWVNAARAKTTSANAGVLLGLTYAF